MPHQDILRPLRSVSQRALISPLLSSAPLSQSCGDGGCVRAVGCLLPTCSPALCALLAAWPCRDTRHLTPNPQHQDQAVPFWERTAQAVMGTYSTGSGQCTPCSLDLLGQMEKNPTLEMVPSTSPRCSTSSHSTPHPNAALRAMLCMSAPTASSVVLDPAPLFAFQTVPFKSTSNRSALTTECLTAWVQHPGVPCTVLGLSPPPPPH